MNEEQWTVLIVDDEPLNIRFLIEPLNSFYSIIVATSGEQAIQRLDEHSIDLVLLDIVMPGMDGFEVLKQIKQNQTNKDLPVIMISGNHDKDDKAKGLELGAAAYLTKPFHIPDVLDKVKTLIQM